MYRDRKGNFHEKPEGVIPKIRESAYGILIRDSKILLIKPSWADIWEFPGGGKESGEEIIDALKREFFEETGFEIVEFEEKPIKVVNSLFYADDLGEYFDSYQHFFLIKKVEKTKEGIGDINEVAEINEVHLHELEMKNIHETHLEILDLIDL